MSKKAKKKKTTNRYTVMLVPEGNEKTFSFGIHRNFLSIIAAAVLIFALGVTVLLFKAGDIGLKLQLVRFLREENTQLRKENEQLQNLASKVDSMMHLIVYLERIGTAIGVESHEIPVPSALGGDQSIFTKDPHDHFLDDLRGGSAGEEIELSNGPRSRPDYLASIPNIRPVEGWITKKFNPNGSDNEGIHNGVDFAAPTGTLIRATAPGIVDSVMHDTYFGLMISVKHKYGFTTRYAHCSQILANPGDRVGRGQTLALVGNTGRSSAPHLHYEILRDGAHVNPLKYILDQGVQ
ncbi:MAG: peptidoglycan DD-metalloendopeptidase family protein [Chitinivibrionales bacterium]|nr:peptidoglycan DD-metalloendopeptidase family protein [Chitinivibrionales bacterium]